jgi:hypothetical protein
MTQTLFKNVMVAVCLNGRESANLPIHRGVQHGCPLAPFLFLFVEEALHAASLQRLQGGIFRGITLLSGTTIDGTVHRRY